ncbi:hypothetical protein HB912_01040 [Listeria aquatica]|uniref:Peptidase A2 domain-containing protein n=1 Tax=Listeria aquatica TaxID=1494960 RepID=A0A841ZMK1_9LIST|nr:aspartyl protease family protein [Listeria aquatica]MBC1520230.1 hypothetical protein [Listeria aquatica]
MNWKRNNKKLYIKNRLILLIGVIDGREYKFLVDTGSERSYMMRDFRLDLYKRKLDYLLKVKGVGNPSLENYEYQIPIINLAGCDIENSSFIVKQKNFYFLDY